MANAACAGPDCSTTSGTNFKLSRAEKLPLIRYGCPGNMARCLWSCASPNSPKCGRHTSHEPPRVCHSCHLSLPLEASSGGKPDSFYACHDADLIILSYNVGILASVLVHPGFMIALHHPNASHTGLITAIYYLGTWLSYIFFSQPASDYLGRRFAALTGTFVACIGSAVEASANGFAAYAMMIIGRIISGLGLAIVSTSVPLYQSEIAPAKQRGRYVVMNHIGMVTGIAIAFWIGYGISFWDSPHGNNVGWRLSIALQYIPAAIFMLGLPFVPETPRWLTEKNRLAQAQSTLHYLREGNYSTLETEHELDEIKHSVEAHKASGDTWTALFTRRHLFSRLWRAALLQFMAQMCGATAMKYYLPTLFTKLGLGHHMSLMASGIESTLKILCTLLEMLAIDRVGRKATLILGSSIMSLAMLVRFLLYDIALRPTLITT